MLKIILVIVGIIILICLLQSLIPFLLFAGILVGVTYLRAKLPGSIKRELYKLTKSSRTAKTVHRNQGSRYREAFFQDRKVVD